jgi:hypothetical protein
MVRIVKPDSAPSEFKCRKCDTMWSNFMENNIPCTGITTTRSGLHDFDFAKPIMVNTK